MGLHLQVFNYLLSQCSYRMLSPWQAANSGQPLSSRPYRLACLASLWASLPSWWRLWGPHSAWTSPHSACSNPPSIHDCGGRHQQQCHQAFHWPQIAKHHLISGMYAKKVVVLGGGGRWGGLVGARPQLSVKKYHFLFLLSFYAEALKTCNIIELFNLCTLRCLWVLNTWFQLTLTVYSDLA